MPRIVIIILLVFSIVFVLTGIGMVLTGTEGGWPGLLFFALCAGVLATRLRPELLVSVKPEPPEALLRRFPGPVELKVSQRRMAALLVGALIFVGVSVWLLLRDPPPSSYGRIMLWACIVMFGAAVPLFLYILLRGAGLRLEAEGFRVTHAWRSYHTRWADAGPFSVVQLRLPIPYVLHDEELVAYDDATARGSRIGALSKGTVGHNAALPDSYNFSHQDLARLMNLWRERALGG